MKVWIDFSNSPHPLLFAPVARRLEREGYDVQLTARDNAQTVELARERCPGVEVIGGTSPRGRWAKAVSIAERVRRLRGWAFERRPQVALSHNSYAQIVAARSLGIPAVTAMDYEHQPANHLAFRLATTILLPESLPSDVVRRQGAAPNKVARYPGLKEELYIGDFEPDPGVVARLGIRRQPSTILVVARTPPSRAIYHGFENSLFTTALREVCSQPDVVCVVLTRHPEQTAAIEKLRLARCTVPPSAIDSRSLIYAADVMLGAGGTMTREASLMGIPTWTLFAGRTPAVDRWLERRGDLMRLTSVRQLSRLSRRGSPPQPPVVLARRASAIEHVFVDAVVRAAQRHSSGPAGAGRAERA